MPQPCMAAILHIMPQDKCGSCRHSHYVETRCGTSRLECCIGPKPFHSKHIRCWVREGQPACPSFDPQFDLDSWRTHGTTSHLWQPPTYADTLDL